MSSVFHYSALRGGPSFLFIASAAKLGIFYVISSLASARGAAASLLDKCVLRLPENTDSENSDTSVNNDSENNDMEVVDLHSAWTGRHTRFCLEREPLELLADGCELMYCDPARVHWPVADYAHRLDF